MAFDANVGSQSFTGKQIIDATHPAVIISMPLKASNGVLDAGLIVAKDTDGNIVAYAPSATDSTANPVGVLVESADTESETIGRVLVHGTVVKDSLVVSGADVADSDIEKLTAIGIYAI